MDDPYASLKAAEADLMSQTFDPELDGISEFQVDMAEFGETGSTQSTSQ